MVIDAEFGNVIILIDIHKSLGEFEIRPYIRSGTTDLAALEHIKIDVAPLSRLTVVVIPGKESGERLQDHWSSGSIIEPNFHHALTTNGMY